MQTLGNKILFKFNDETIGNKTFSNVSEGGIVFNSFEHDTKTPRYATVLTVGPDVKSVKVDDVILIDNLRWSEKISYTDGFFWMTTENEVIGIVQK